MAIISLSAIEQSLDDKLEASDIAGLATEGYVDTAIDGVAAIDLSNVSQANARTVVGIWTGTQAAYNAITTKDPAVLYFIT